GLFTATQSVSGRSTPLPSVSRRRADVPATCPARSAATIMAALAGRDGTRRGGGDRSTRRAHGEPRWGAGLLASGGRRAAGRGAARDGRAERRRPDRRRDGASRLPRGLARLGVAVPRVPGAVEGQPGDGVPPPGRGGVPRAELARRARVLSRHRRPRRGGG